MKREERAMQLIATEEKVLLLFDSVKIFLCVVYTHIQAKQNIHSDFQMCHCSVEVWSMYVFNKISGYKTQTFK